MFARVGQAASECCPERGLMPSRLAIDLKKGLFGDAMPMNSMDSDLCSSMQWKKIDQ
jgi:hypothetical protein